MNNNIFELEARIPKSVWDIYTFARYWHDKTGIKRKQSEAPYIVHPMRVAIAGVERGCTDAEICVRLCHDLKEDVDELSDDLLFKTVGPEIYMGIWWLTSPDKCDTKLAKLNRATRKYVTEEKLALAPLAWKIAKLDDKNDNMQDCLIDSPQYELNIREAPSVIAALTRHSTMLLTDPAYLNIVSIINKSNRK